MLQAPGNQRWDSAAILRAMADGLAFLNSSLQAYVMPTVSKRSVKSTSPAKHLDMCEGVVRTALDEDCSSHSVQYSSPLLGIEGSSNSVQKLAACVTGCIRFRRTCTRVCGSWPVGLVSSRDDPGRVPFES